MDYYKVVRDGYILGIGIGSHEERISEEEYNAIFAFVQTMPRRAGYGYRLRTDFTWEEYERPEEDEDATAEDYENALGRFGV